MKTIFIYQVIFLLHFLLNINLVNAQTELTDAAPNKAEKKLFVSGRNIGNFSPYTGFELFTTENGTEVSGNLAANFGNRTLTFEVGSPLSQNSNRIQPLDLNGLAKASRFGVGYAHCFWKGKVRSPKALDDFFESNKVDGKRINDIDALPDDLKEVLAEREDIIDWGNIWIINTSISYNRQDFSYLNENDITNIIQEDKNGYLYSLSIGYFTKKNLDLFKLSFIRKKSYLISETAEIIRTQPNTGIQEIRTLGLTSPQENTESHFRLEGVFLLDREQLGINPSLNYFSSKKLWSFDLPIYFLRKKEDGKLKELNGGIFAGLNFVKNRMDFDPDFITFGVFLNSNFGSLF